MTKTKIITFVAALFVAFGAISQPAVLPGKIDVSAIGAGTYTIPIEVVPGTNGVQPNLSVVYNSMSGLNVLGQKWGLAGLSAITRVSQNRYYDGNVSPVAFDTTDRLALDDNRMILFSGASYHSNNAVYCFETEDFSRIERLLSQGGNLFFKPNVYYARKMADGSVVTYGSDSQSRGVGCWMVSKVTDVNGNYMKYYYQKAAGEIWIDHIDYTILSDGASAYASVTFEYDGMAAANDRFVANQQIRQSKRLKSIVVKYQGTQIRKYAFSYNTSLQYDRLSSVSLYDANNVLLSRTNISWTTPSSTMITDETLSLLPTGSYATSGNFDADRVYDIYSLRKNGNNYTPYLIKKSSDGTSFTLTSLGYNFPTNNFDNLSAVDIDGDGIDEIIYRNCNDATYYSLKVTQSGNVSPSSIFWSYASSLLWGDFDGDGILEPVAFNKDDNFINFRNLEGTNNTVATLQNSYEYCYAGDFNGDGKTDLMFLKGLYNYIYTYNTRSHNWEQFESGGFPNAYQKLVVGDYNGDGVSDVLFLPNNETQWKIAIRYGKNNWTYPEQIIPELDGTHKTTNSVDPKYLPFACDINGDGKSDILQPVADYTVNYIISKGCYENTYQYAQSGTFTHTRGQLFRPGNFTMGDFDGNGIADILFFNYNPGSFPGSIKYFYKGKFTGYYVNQISDGANKKIKLDYSTISFMPNRFIGTGMNWMPLPLVKNLIVSNGLNGFDTTSFYYGDAQYDASRHQFIGFSLFGMKNNNRISETFLSRVPKGSNASFALLMPDSVVSYIAPHTVNVGNNPYWSYMVHIAQPTNDILISKTVNTKSSLYRTNALGNVSFLPYASTSTEYDYLKNSKTVKQVSMGSNWRPSQQTTTIADFLGSSNRSSLQYVNYTYVNNTMQNGVSVVKPSRIVTRQYNNTTNSNPRRDTVSYTYNSYGQLSKKIHSDNGGLYVTEEYFYNGNGILTSVTTMPRGATSSHSVSFEYDPTNRFVTRTTDHANNVTRKTYDPATGLTLTETDINNLVTRYEYDNYSRPTKVVYPDSTTKTITYTNSSDGLTNTYCYTTVTETGKPETRTYYDLLGRKTHTYVAGQGYMDVVYNKLGQVTKQTLLPNNSTSMTTSSKKWKTFQYDVFGRVVKDSSNYQKNIYSYWNVVSDYPMCTYYEKVEDKKGARSTQYYDAAGRVIQVKDNGGTINYSYDRLSQSGKINDRMQITTGGKTTTIISDSRGNRLSLTDPDAGTTTCTYDAWGNLLTQTDGKGDVTTMTYDNQNRVTSKRYSMGNDEERYGFMYGTAAPMKGKIFRVIHNNTLYQEYGYDNLGRVTSGAKRIDGNIYTHHYTYNSDGKLHTTQYPSGYVIRREYDANGRLLSLKDNATNAAIYTVDSRNNLSQPKRCWFGNGTGVEYTYDAWGLPTQIKYGYREVHWPEPLGGIKGNNGGTKGGGYDDIIVIGDDPVLPIVGPTYSVGSQYSVLQYTYNNNGYITRKKDTKIGQQEDFSYDDLGRLTSVSINGAQTYNYQYESNGNIKQNDLLGNSNYTYSTSKPHAVTQVIDENGALPTSMCNVTYNNRNRPATISEGNWTMDLFYDEGLQREKSVLKNGNTTVNTTYFISKNCEYEINPTYSRYIDYIYADGRIVALHVHNTTVNADSLYYVQTDLLGSWDRIVDGSKNVVQSSHFDPWGNRMSATDWTDRQDGSEFSFRRGFTGHEHYDRFGIINMNARLYDPILGRFFSPDPQVQSPFSTQGFNRYSYCGNNPVMYIDEDGEFAWLIPAIIGAAIGMFQGYSMALDNGASGWDMVGYIAGGALIGGVAGIAGAGAAAAVGGACGALGIGGAFGGAITGGAAGGAAGAMNGLGMSLLSGNSFGNSMEQMGYGFLYGAAGGAFLGGVAGGVSAKMDGNKFWTGKSIASEMPPCQMENTSTYQTPQQKGQAGVEHVIQEFESEGYTTLQREVTIELNGVRVRVDIATQSPNMEITLIEVKNGPYANFTPNQKIVYPQMMLDHAPIVPLGQNAANVWGPAQVGQPTTNYTIIIIKLF